MKSKLKNYAIVVAILLFFAAPALASELKLNINGETIGIDQQFEIRLLLDTQNKTINAVEGKVKFSSDFLELKEIRDGNSIINFWIEKPSNSGNEIKFSGIIPGGYNGQNGLIFSLIFESKKDGKTKIAMESINILLNDGEGTEDAVAVKNLELKIEKTGNASASAIFDRDLPEDFKPLIGRDKNIFNGKWFLSFITQDKGSGIDYYQIQERWFWQPSNARWEKAESPYLFKDQWLWSYIYVKALDRAGNARLVVLPPSNMPLYRIFIIFGIMIVGVLLLARRIYGGNVKTH